MVNDPALLILTSPPATGKTYWIFSFFELWKQDLLVVSPLRALADECKQKWGSHIMVMTPEEWMRNKKVCSLVIFDEFHLNFYWGDSFRPVLWEAFYEITSRAELTILLTATLSREMIEEIKHYRCHFSEILWTNHGNQKLKNFPSNYIQAPNKDWLMQKIFNEDKGNKTNLIFCQFRNEVFEMEKKLKRMKYRVVSCVGGRSKEMAKKLEVTKKPDFIVATTVLSHGVNLPEISQIYFLYAVKNIDFWIQMIARGGRRGGKFEVYALERPFVMKWSPWKNRLFIWLHNFKQIFTWKTLREAWVHIKMNHDI